jgi:hypothetical protein
MYTTESFDSNLTARYSATTGEHIKRKDAACAASFLRNYPQRCRGEFLEKCEDLRFALVCQTTSVLALLFVDVEPCTSPTARPLATQFAEWIIKILNEQEFSFVITKERERETRHAVEFDLEDLPDRNKLSTRSPTAGPHYRRLDPLVDRYVTGKYDSFHLCTPKNGFCGHYSKALAYF